ncbi:MAG: (2Fe-2S)-binding protein [Schaedlerella sp.]|nr:(2Fe-2S)-binding protein [Lachnospiraceae bacterium]MDY4201582.1 (2Fe-2S)-binding protein [Schaedlerella sp.]
MNLDKIVCNCLDVTNGMIKDAVENGANTLEEVQEITGAGTVCGACIDDVQRLIDYFVAERDK